MVVIDIDMPQTCEVCPCFDNVYGECQISAEYTIGVDVCGKRSDKCPISLNEKSDIEEDDICR